MAIAGVARNGAFGSTSTGTSYARQTVLGTELPENLFSQNRIMSSNAVYATDENGNPFIILREQENKHRVHGLEAQKVRTLRS